MAKRLFLLLLSSFIGVVLTPSFLTADDFTLAKTPDFNAVETVPLPEPEPEPEPVKTYSTPAVAKPVVAAPVYEPPKIPNYTVSFYIGSVGEFNNTALNLSYSGLYKYNKMVYGHNSYNLLGNLSSRYIGETITITEGGVTRTYQVTSIQRYQKTADGYLEGDKSLMGRIANAAMGYDVALFTCAGTSYGNGDASHRLVVFANQI